MQRLDDVVEKPPKSFELVVDRVVLKKDDDFKNRLSDAIEIAFFEGNGSCAVVSLDGKNRKEFSNNFEADGMQFVVPNVHLFSFNNPFGACSKCEGYGDIIGIDPDLVIPNTGLSIYEEAIVPWKSGAMRKYYDDLVNNAYRFDFPIHKPFYELDQDQKDLIWKGNSYFTGLDKFFKKLKLRIIKFKIVFYYPDTEEKLVVTHVKELD